MHFILRFHFHLECKISQISLDKSICPADVEVLMEVVMQTQTESPPTPTSEAPRMNVRAVPQQPKAWLYTRLPQTAAFPTLVEEKRAGSCSKSWWVWEGTSLLTVEFADFVHLKESCVCSGDVSKCRCVQTHSCECRPLSGDSKPHCLSARLGCVLYE